MALNEIPTTQKFFEFNNKYLENIKVANEKIDKLFDMCYEIALHQIKIIEDNFELIKRNEELTKQLNTQKKENSLKNLHIYMEKEVNAGELVNLSALSSADFLDSCVENNDTNENSIDAFSEVIPASPEKNKLSKLRIRLSAIDSSRKSRKSTSLLRQSFTGKDEVDFNDKEDKYCNTNHKPSFTQRLETCSYFKPYLQLPHEKKIFSKKNIDFAYEEKMPRKKHEKNKLEGFQCRECKVWFDSDGVTAEERKKILNKCSKHRAKFDPGLDKLTPPSFWNPVFSPCSSEENN